jgi:flagellin
LPGPTGPRPLALDVATTLNVIVSQDGQQQLGITQSDLQVISFAVGVPSLGGLGMSFNDAANRDNSQGYVKFAIDSLAVLRAHNGTQQSQLMVALSTLGENKANLQLADGRIQDVDVASESTKLASQSIRHEAGTAMLAQANQGHQVLLRLLG